MKTPRSIAEMRIQARRRLPRFAFDFIDGGAGHESALARNMRSFDAVRLTPALLSGAVTRSQSVTLFGRHYATAFGIAPMGLANIVRPGTDLALARAAAAADIPYVLSTAASTSIETIATVAPNTWFQLYVGRDQPIVDDLIARADAIGLPVLVVTADVPVPGKRLRDLANGFTLPFRPSLRIALDLLSRPLWSLRMLTGGSPRFANLVRYTHGEAGRGSLAELMARQCSARLDWELLGRLRQQWTRILVLKGVLDPRDARRAQGLGIDGIIVSNHGGRQLESAPAPLEVLSRLRAAVGGEFPLLIDGGIRTGDDVVRALALGADAVLLGRAFLYSTAALGAAGPEALIELLRDEIDRVLAQLGCREIAELKRVLIHCPGPEAPLSGDASAS